jgi:hypothetical protein
MRDHGVVFTALLAGKLRARIETTSMMIAPVRNGLEPEISR